MKYEVNASKTYHFTGVNPLDTGPDYIYIWGFLFYISTTNTSFVHAKSINHISESFPYLFIFICYPAFKRQDIGYTM